MKLFEILLVVLTLASGLILLADKLYLAKRRAQRAACSTPSRCWWITRVRSSRCWRSC